MEALGEKRLFRGLKIPCAMGQTDQQTGEALLWCGPSTVSIRVQMVP